MFESPAMNKTLHDLLDPLCGWCYGASPGLNALAGIPGLQLQLLPSGLFSNDGARAMDEAFATYAGRNDQRIERLTGQHFSERYRSTVLGGHQHMFDSGPATMALTAPAPAPRGHCSSALGRAVCLLLSWSRLAATSYCTPACCSQNVSTL